jgi:hypothetical protein
MHGISRCLENTPRMIVKILAIRCQRNPMRQPLEQARPEPALERQHGIRDRRLGDVLVGRRHRELPRLRRRHEVAQLPQRKIE